MTRIFSLFVALWMTTVASAQYGQIIYDNYIYEDYIKTVTFTNKGIQTSHPVIDFNSPYQGQLQLGFDDLEGGYKTYVYRLVHCDKDWYPSDLQEIEYIDGFNYEEIDDFAYSVNPYSEYTHYELTLPNEDIRWTISGNYILAVYDEELQIPVLTRRFMVVDNKVDIAHRVRKPRDVLKLNTHQDLEFSINHKGFHITRPRQDLYVTVIQNGNWNSARRNLQGIYERGETVFFDAFDFIVFPALKEWRSFDIRSLKYTTENVHSIDRDSEGSTVLLELDRKRYTRNFISEIDANGFFIVENDDYPDPEVSSEYAEVIFALDTDGELDKELYVVGRFCDFQPREAYKMVYDPVRKIYAGAARFKQGYYDYMYALLNEDGTLDIDSIEGSWYETENDYLVLVYYRDLGGRYDQLIGVANFNSNPSN